MVPSFEESKFTTMSNTDKYELKKWIDYIYLIIENSQKLIENTKSRYEFHTHDYLLNLCNLKSDLVGWNIFDGPSHVPDYTIFVLDCHYEVGSHLQFYFNYDGTLYIELSDGDEHWILLKSLMSEVLTGEKIVFSQDVKLLYGELLENAITNWFAGVKFITHMSIYGFPDKPIDLNFRKH